MFDFDWEHYNGGIYRVVDFACFEANGETLVIYHSVTNRAVRFARPASEFFGVVRLEQPTSTGMETTFIPRFKQVKRQGT